MPGPLVMLGIPTLSTSRRSPVWIDAMAGLQMPLGASFARTWTQDQIIDEARNSLCRAAIDADARYLVMLGDDVIPPSDMIVRMLDRIGRTVSDGLRDHKIRMIAGVYWTKGLPLAPYLWNGLLEGPFFDWRLGEVVPVDYSGCDALMIDVALLRELDRPWFSRDWVFGEGDRKNPILTEDFYFYAKARESGHRLWVDTSIQCGHEDRTTGIVYGMPEYWPMDIPRHDGEWCVVDVGSLGSPRAYNRMISATQQIPTNARVIRVDEHPHAGPDYRAPFDIVLEDLRGRADEVHGDRVLQRVAREVAPAVIRTMAAYLKAGGMLRLMVDDTLSGVAVGGLGDGEADTLDWLAPQHIWGQIYGSSAMPYRNAFTPRKLRALIASSGMFDDVRVEATDGTIYLEARRSAADTAAPSMVLRTSHLNSIARDLGAV